MKAIKCLAGVTAFAISASAAAEKIYWTRECGGNQILRANLDGSCVEVLVNGASCATDLTLDIDNGKMYWTEPSHNRIRRANLDGSEAEIILSYPEISCPNGITLDLERAKLYWTERCGGVLNRLRRANLDGSCIETIVTNTEGATSVAIDPTPADCPADFDCSGAVDVDDLVTLITAWGECGGYPLDVTGDGTVNIDDLVAVITSWGPCAAP